MKPNKSNFFTYVNQQSIYWNLKKFKKKQKAENINDSSVATRPVPCGRGTPSGSTGRLTVDLQRCQFSWSPVWLWVKFLVLVWGWQAEARQRYKERKGKWKRENKPVNSDMSKYISNCSSHVVSTHKWFEQLNAVLNNFPASNFLADNNQTPRYILTYTLHCIVFKSFLIYA